MASKKMAEKKRQLLGDDHSLLVLIAILNILILFSVLILGALGIMSSAEYGPQMKNQMRGMMFQRPMMEQRGPQMHPSWDADLNGINDCENDGSCDHMVDYTKPRADSPYGPETWKTMISSSCQSFYDGCNTCTRAEGEENLAACTLRFCAEYEMPRCLDEEQAMSYDQNSWKTIIPASCQSFFDGCNNCQRIAGEDDIAACTRKFCQEYQQPSCLDE